MNDMCAECGADLRRDDTAATTASVPMIHSIPDLKVSEEVRSTTTLIQSKRSIFELFLI